MTEDNDLCLSNRDEGFGSLEPFIAMKKKHFDFLKEYQKDLDLERSLKESGVSVSQLNGNSDLGKSLRAKITKINEDFMAALDMNTASAARRHWKLFDKMEKVFDDGDNEIKTKMASSLTRMSDTALKATNNYDYGAKKPNEGVTVEINIDLSSNAEEKIINAEVIEDGDN